MTDDEITVLEEMRDSRLRLAQHSPCEIDSAILENEANALTAALDHIREVGELLEAAMKIEIGRDPMERESIRRTIEGKWEYADDEYDSALSAWREVKEKKDG
jgi:hypothetical protein